MNCLWLNLTVSLLTIWGERRVLKPHTHQRQQFYLVSWQKKQLLCLFCLLLLSTFCIVKDIYIVFLFNELQQPRRFDGACFDYCICVMIGYFLNYQAYSYRLLLSYSSQDFLMMLALILVYPKMFMTEFSFKISSSVHCCELFHKCDMAMPLPEICQ